ncbi:unnamed protein product [Calypogeia fissa]
MVTWTLDSVGRRGIKQDRLRLSSFSFLEQAFFFFLPRASFLHRVLEATSGNSTKEIAAPSIDLPTFVLLCFEVLGSTVVVEAVWKCTDLQTRLRNHEDPMGLSPLLQLISRSFNVCLL